MAYIKLIAVLALCLALVGGASAQQALWEKLNQQVMKLEDEGKYVEGARIGERALEIATKTFGPNHLKVASSLNNLAGLYRQQGKYAEAEPLYKRSLAIKEKALGKDHPRVALSLNNLAVLYRQQGRYAEVELLHKRSLEIREKALGKGHPDVAESLNNLASLYWHQHKYAEAELLYKRSLAIREKALGKDHPDVANSLNNLGTVYEDQGKYAEAELLYKSSLEIDEKALGKDHPSVATDLNNLAQVYRKWGKYAEAEPLYKRSLAIKEKALGKDHPRVAGTLNNLGLLYQYEGKIAEAEPLHKRSLAIREKALGKDHPDVAQSLMYLGGLHWNRGDYAEALRMFEASLDILKRKGLSVRTPQSAIAEIYLDQGEISKAEPIIKERGGEVTMGRLSLMKKEFDRAKGYYEQVRKSGEEARHADQKFVGFTGLGMAFEGLRDDTRAAEYYRRAVDFTEELRSSLKRTDREKFFDVKIFGFYRTAPYEGYVRAMLRMNKPLEALKGSEYCKARVYAERISARPQTVRLDLPATVLQQDDSLQNQLSALKQSREEAYKQKNQDRIKALEPQIAKLEERFKGHVKMLRDKYPLFAATKYPQPMDVEQTAVKPEEWTLAYQVTDTGICIWLLRGKTLVKSLFKPIPRKDLNQLVRSFRKPLDMDEITPKNLLAFKDSLPTGKNLFTLLVADLLESIPEGKPLIILPDGMLGVVPFEMLVIKEGTGWNTSSKRPYPEGVVYFGDRNPISYYQSLTALTLARTLGQTKKTGPRTLVMADPVFQSDDTRLQQMEKKRRQELLASVSDKLMSIKNETGLVFNRLPLTGDLGTALKKLQPDSTDLYVGMDARKPLLFKEPLDKYQSVVFATHGYVGEGLPGIMEPVLVLTLVDQPKDKDGFLRMSEVMSLDLSADVVALTACQTGLGREVKGEGTMGMGRAFQYAGAKSVLISLWSVSEVSTTRMAEKFLSYVKQGKNRLEALQMARKEIRAEGYEHPFYWAPFILVGEVK